MLELRGGRMLMQRIGPLTPTRQRCLERMPDGPFGEVSRRNPRAPEPRGLWACPFPLFEPFLASYQRELATPPRFKAAAFARIESAHNHGAIDAETRDTRRRALQAEFAAWQLTKTERDRTRVRKFWISGRVWTHLGLGHKGASAYYADQWQLVSIQELARLVRRRTTHTVPQAGRARTHATSSRSSWAATPHSLISPRALRPENLLTAETRCDAPSSGAGDDRCG